MRQQTRDRVLRIGSAIGYGLGLAALIVAVQADGGRAYDAHSYWLAGRNVLSGDPLYQPIPIGGLGLYSYPPIFAQLWAPFSVLPELAFTWAYRIACFLCLRYLAGSWRNVGLWLLLPWTITELSAANVIFPMAAAIFASFRGHPWLAPWAGLLKVGGFLLVPYLWVTRPAERRTIAFGLAAVVAVCLVSVVLAPQSWDLFVQSLGWQITTPVAQNGMISILPTAAADFGLRLAVAFGFVLLAIRLRSDRIAYVAAVVTVPALWPQRLVPVLAAIRLPGRPRTPASAIDATDDRWPVPSAP